MVITLSNGLLNGLLNLWGAMMTDTDYLLSLIYIPSPSIILRVIISIRFPTFSTLPKVAKDTSQYSGRSN